MFYVLCFYWYYYHSRHDKCFNFLFVQNIPTGLEHSTLLNNLTAMVLFTNKDVDILENIVILFNVS